MADNAVWQWMQAIYRNDAWIYEVFAVVLATVSVNALVRLGLTRLVTRLAQRTQTYWDDALVGAARRPLAWLVWVLGLSVAAGLAEPHAVSEVFAYVPPLRALAVIVLFAWFLIGFIDRVARAVTASRPNVDPTTALAVSRLLRVSVIVTAVLVALQSLGFSISGVLAFGGVGGIAVGFAAKDLLANFFGGVMIHLDRPFGIGDWIRSPDRDIEGVVEEIGWRLTTIRTFDKRPLYVPNSAFTTITVENPSRMSHRRIRETIGLRYDDIDVLPALLDDVRALLIAHPDIDDSQTLMVNFDTFGESSLQFFVYCFTHTTNWVEFHRIKQAVLVEIMAIVARHGARVAQPTRRLQLDAAAAAPVHDHAPTTAC
ncbi:mechanosensitive ion channel family protein [Jeongeupia sp. USM3]|uniref:mechanosensitive ion channel family protein n=1 Tax=Jeongeupia sp. USM3 TaxID=1906741 RepID=UPI00089DD951|nr:mechanosensitive ion channel family protein [Jeongeupia sp. USM3]AOY00681.1 mechanosensitive ion channel protein MscS [Jeongeupia sp. USM3]